MLTDFVHSCSLFCCCQLSEPVCDTAPSKGGPAAPPPPPPGSLFQPKAPGPSATAASTSSSGMSAVFSELNKVHKVFSSNLPHAIDCVESCRGIFVQHTFNSALKYNQWTFMLDTKQNAEWLMLTELLMLRPLPKHVSRLDATCPKEYLCCTTPSSLFAKAQTQSHAVVAVGDATSPKAAQRA